MTVPTSKSDTERRASTEVAASPEPPALAPAAAHSPRDLSDLPEPRYVYMTPFYFRVLVAGVFAFAAVLGSWALAQVLFAVAAPSAAGGSLQIMAAGALALLLCGAAFRFCNPLDRQKWFRLALTRDGLYFPGRGSNLIFVPWSALVAVDVERWYGKGGEHSAARLRLDLDDQSWSRFGRAARIEGKGRVRRISVHVVDMTGDEIAARIRACRADSPAA